ncbi:hypothetical protein J6590_091198 [Homalodisca vitripennis]|nr:hypothetical protein J6590_091198 [Homalodisca vitripennis]
MDIPGLSGRLLFKHLLQLWISRGYLGKLQTPSTALDIPGLSTETSHTFYSSGYPGLIYGNFTHLLQLWISRGCLGDSSSNTFYSYEYPGVVWETPLQTPSTALDIPGLFRETSDTFYSSGYPGVIYGNFTHLLQLWISRGCLRKLHTPSTARVALITARVHPGMVHQSQKSRNPINPVKGRSTKSPSRAMDIPGLSGRLLFKHLLQLWISRGCLGKLQTPSTALDIPGLSTETSHTFYSSGYPGVVYGNFRHLLQLWISRGCLRKLHTPSTALDIPGFSTETSDTFYSSGYPGVVYGNFTHLLQLGPALITARVHAGMVHQSQKSRNPINPDKGRSTKALLQLWISRGCLGDSSSNNFYGYGYPRGNFRHLLQLWISRAYLRKLHTPSTALYIPGLSGRLLFKHLLQLWISQGFLGDSSSNTFYSSGYPGVVYGNFTHLLQLWISRGCLRKLQTPSTALDIPGLSTETSHTFYSLGRLVRRGQTRPALITARVHPGMVHQSQKSRNPINPDKGSSSKALLQLWISRGCLGDSSSNTFYSYGYPGVVWETPLQTPSTAMDIPGLSGRLLFKHLLQLWISRGYLGKLQTPSTALDIPGLSTETSHTFYSSGYPGLIYGNFTHLLQLWISRGCLGDSSSNTFYSYEYPGVVWETPLQTPSTALDIPRLSRETSDTFYSSGYPGVIYGNSTHLLQLWISRGCLRKLHTPSTARPFYSYGYPGVVWETPLQTPSTAMDIPGLSRETSDTFYSSGYPGVVYGNFTHLLQLWISRGCLRKLQTPSTALDIPGLSTETSHTFYSSGRLVRGGQTRPALITARVHAGMVHQSQKSRNPINPDKGRSTKVLLQLWISRGCLGDSSSNNFYGYGYPRVV